MFCMQEIRIACSLKKQGKDINDDCRSSNWAGSGHLWSWNFRFRSFRVSNYIASCLWNFKINSNQVDFRSFLLKFKIRNVFRVWVRVEFESIKFQITLGSGLLTLESIQVGLGRRNIVKNLCPNSKSNVFWYSNQISSILKENMSMEIALSHFVKYAAVDIPYCPPWLFLC